MVKHTVVVAAAISSLVACTSDSPKPSSQPAATSSDQATPAETGSSSSDDSRAAPEQPSKAGRFLDGSELVGTAPPAWTLSEWVRGSAKTLADLRGQVVVVRFWTSPDCPFCAKTMPALQGLADEFAKQPVVVIGAYHAKPIRSVADMSEPSELAVRWKVRFPIAFDREWKTLRSWWLDSAPRRATSVTFVIGKDGKIVFVHPGPVFHPSEDPAEAKQNRDYQAVRQSIVDALAK